MAILGQENRKEHLNRLNAGGLVVRLRRGGADPFRALLEVAQLVAPGRLVLGSLEPDLEPAVEKDLGDGLTAIRRESTCDAVNASSLPIASVM